MNDEGRKERMHNEIICWKMGDASLDSPCFLTVSGSPEGPGQRRKFLTVELVN
jgi:hypothetical protein